MTLWTLLKSKDWEEEARKELEAERQAREADRLVWQQSLEESRAFQRHILDQLAEDRAAQTQVTTRVLDLLEQMTHRLNGESNGNANGSTHHTE